MVGRCLSNSDPTVLSRHFRAFRDGVSLQDQTRRKPEVNRDGRRLITRQRGRCPLCGNLLLHADTEPQHPDEWEQWITAIRKAVRAKALTVQTGNGGTDDHLMLHLVHAD